MGYVEKEIARQQRVINDAIAGKGLKKAIGQLQERSRIKSTLKDKQPRPTITAKAGVGKRAASGSNVFTELSRTLHATERSLTSSDGLFVLLYANVKVILCDNGSFYYADPP